MLTPLITAAAGVFGELITKLIDAAITGEDWEPLVDAFPAEFKATIAQELKRKEVLEELREIRRRHGG